MAMTVTGEDLEQLGETVTYWVIYSHGGVGRVDVTNGAEPEVDGRLVDEAEYLARLEEIKEGRAAYLAGLLAADEQRTREDYEALLGAGVPEATARRMSGYEGD
ncbi:hypothetical protein [Streptomyces sp. NPDC047070]|uniref:hypothetical protein n=1 Tax=Streptomyces sp. NPDC047070 TaxID=3154923 RepID=UPI00345347B5